MTNETEEKKEFLKREEIRTMGKDVAKLRETETEKERERVAALEVEKTKKEKIPVPPPTPPIIPPPVPKTVFPPVPPTPPPIVSPPLYPPFKEEIKKVEEIPSITLIPKPPKRPPLFTKVLIRTIIITVLVLVLGFSLFLILRKPPTEEKLPPPPPVEKPTIPPEEKLEINIPPALIAVSQTKTPEISKLEEIPTIFSQLMKEELPVGSFTQVAIKDLSQNRLVSLKELAFVYQVEVPEEFYQKLEENFTLTIFSQREGKRVALVVKVKEKEGLNEILKNWETKIKKEEVFLSGKKIPTLSSYFKTAFYQNIGFRYLTITKNDFGICYAWFDDYFVFTTSFESLKKVIDEIKIQELEKKIGQLFIVGFEGKEVSPQLEDFFKKYRPGGVLLLSKNIENKEQLKTLISDLQKLSLRETGFPLFVAVDQEGGIISRIGFLEEKTSQSEIENQERAYQIGLKRGEELKELGVNLNLAPLLDITTSSDFIFQRAFQKNPEEIGDLAKSLILGQKEAGILTTIKHFPGYSGISFNPEEELAILEKIPEILQFKKAMESNPEFVMTSNVIYQGIDSSLPFTFSSKGIQFLKTNLGNQVMVISDDLDQKSLLNKFPLKEIVTKPLQAGVDILIFSGYRLPVEQGLSAFFEAVKNKEISETRINEIVSRIAELKKELLK